MYNIKARNVHAALPEVLRELSIHGIPAETRNGPVLQFPAPLCVEYTYPRERVLFWEQRDANPFFHFFESLWMLAGRNDVAFLAPFAKQISEYSDDGETYHGAYGYRWRKHFGADQIQVIIDNLKNNPACRRQVLGMWSPATDLWKKPESKDIPCNLVATFQVGTLGLNMTVFNRSNDILWGMLGANAVHFSFLQEYIASSIDQPVGSYYQISVNAHAYRNELYDRCRVLIESADDPTRKVQSWNPYRDYHSVAPIRLFDGADPDYRKSWDADLGIFFRMVADEPELGFETFHAPFFRNTVWPLYEAHVAYKAIVAPNAEPWAESYWEGIYEWLYKVAATDWRKACTEWMQRREASWKRKQG